MNYNRVILGGNITKDIELRQTTSGVSVVGFSIAINGAQFNDKQETVFVDCSVFGKSAETIAKFFKKGSQILIEGRLRQDSWEDKQLGQKRSKLSVVVERWEFVDKQQATSASAHEGVAECDDIPF